MRLANEGQREASHVAKPVRAFTPPYSRINKSADANKLIFLNRQEQIRKRSSAPRDIFSIRRTVLSDKGF